MNFLKELVTSGSSDEATDDFPALPKLRERSLCKLSSHKRRFETKNTPYNIHNGRTNACGNMENRLKGVMLPEATANRDISIFIGYIRLGYHGKCEECPNEDSEIFRRTSNNRWQVKHLDGHPARFTRTMISWIVYIQ
jgi:hypothetical protein